MPLWTSGRRPLFIAALLVFAAGWLLWPHAALDNAGWNQLLNTAVRVGARAPDFPAPDNRTVWINSPPLTLRALRGQVVMIDFWDYTCINCIRTFPQTKLWYQRYHSLGFEVIGVHDPEFPFAAPVENVRAAAARFGLPYPIVADNGHEIWRAYANTVWPNRFLIDAKGIVRYNVEGEGHDREFEEEIQKLLRAAHPDLKFSADGSVVVGTDMFSSGCGSTTPEMYVGNWHGAGVVGSRPGYHNGKTTVYAPLAHLADGTVSLTGAWESRPEGMIARAAGDQLAMAYHSREAYAVLSLAAGAGQPLRVEVKQDGRNLPRDQAGVDVQFDAAGHSYVAVAEPRMYYLAVNPSDSAHTLTLLPAAPGVMVSTFTFGNNCMQGFEHR